MYVYCLYIIYKSVNHFHHSFQVGYFSYYFIHTIVMFGMANTYYMTILRRIHASTFIFFSGGSEAAPPESETQNNKMTFNVMESITAEMSLKLSHSKQLYNLGVVTIIWGRKLIPA